MSNQGGYKVHDPFGTYFVTFTIVGWVDLFTRKACKDIMIDSLRYCQENKGLIVNAFVIMVAMYTWFYERKKGVKHFRR